jgi:hypothetical protein
MTRMKDEELVLYFDIESTAYEKTIHVITSIDDKSEPSATQISFILFDPRTYVIKDIRNSYVQVSDMKSISDYIAIKTGITSDIRTTKGVNIVIPISKFLRAWSKCTRLASHNIRFDIIMMVNEIIRNYAALCTFDPELRPIINSFLQYRHNYSRKCATYSSLVPKEKYCTMRKSIDICKLSFDNKFQSLSSAENYKWAELDKLYEVLFPKEPLPQPLHNAMIDVLAGLRCYIKIHDNHHIHNVKFAHMLKRAIEIAEINNPAQTPTGIELPKYAPPRRINHSEPLEGLFPTSRALMAPPPPPRARTSAPLHARR